MRLGFTKWVILLAVVTALLSAGSCLHAGGAGGEKITLRLWGAVPRKDDTSPWASATRAVFEEFRKRHPEIEIVNSAGLQISGPASESRSQMRFKRTLAWIIVLGILLTMAALAVAALPTLLIFLFTQNVIMRGIVIPSYK